MRNKKSVLKTLSVSYDCSNGAVTGIAGNYVLHTFNILNQAMSMLISKIKEHLSLRIENGELSNEDMVQLIEHIGDYLNIKTIPDYCKETGISYNGAKKHRNIRKIFGVKFVIENN